MIDLIGNSPIREQIEQIDLTPPLGLSWIFQGPKGIGKALFAKQWALNKLQEGSPSKNPLSNHPDLFIIKPSGKTALHTMESLRAMSEQVVLPPSLSQFKVFIIQDAERLPITCANYLLKTLEEPPQDTLFILTTDEPEALPQTIHSRCRTFFFHPLSIKEIAAWLEAREGSDQKQANSVAEKSGGSLAKAARFFHELGDESRATRAAALARAHALTLSEIIELSEHFAQNIEKQKKERIKELEKSLSSQKDRFSPAALEGLRLQIKGEATLLEKDLIAELFEQILLFFRDLWALKYESASLHYSDHKELIEQVTKKPSFVDVENLLIEAKRQLIYSTKLTLVLQRFFLNLREAY